MKRETTTSSRQTLLAARRWYLVDAQGKTVGRLASTIAGVLRGKNTPAFSTHLDSGHFVVVINARQVRFSGKKPETKSIIGIQNIRAGSGSALRSSSWLHAPKRC